MMIKNLCVLFSIALISSVSIAQTPEKKAQAIGDAMSAAMQGFGDNEILMDMELVTRKNRVSKRKFTIKTLEGKNDNTKTLLVFNAPKDLKGTVFLTHTYRNKDNNQWLYFPSSKRVKKIAAKGSSGSFLGSEFTYEDLSGFELDNYKSKWIKEDEISGKACDQIENIPTSSSGYSKVVACIEKARHVPLKVDFFAKNGKLLKTLTSKNYQQYKGKYWLAHNVTMKNHKTGKATHLNIQSAKFNVGLKDSYFSQNNLKRIR